MHRSSILWILAFLVTAGSAVYQRLTGPTHPLQGSALVGETRVEYELPRSHGGNSDCSIEIPIADDAIQGTIEWKHHNIEERYYLVPMLHSNGRLVGTLPHQPPSGKLDYRIILQLQDATTSLPAEPAVIRFKGDVPLTILICHILAMFTGMLCSNRAGLGAIVNKTAPGRIMIWTLILLATGGIVLGPFVQWYAFGAFWTGWPVGHDLTDNKTAVALIAWIFAYVMAKRSSRPGRWILAAALITLSVYMIPHSVLGSELTYQPPR